MDNYFKGLRINVLYNLIAGIIIFAILALLRELGIL